MNLFCFGMGYSGKAIASRLSERRWAISGTGRTPEAASHITSLGHRGFLFEGMPPADDRLASALRGATHVLVSVPPGEQGDPVLAHYADLLAQLDQLETIAYLSTVGVYGDWQGAWVDEESPTRASSPRSIRRLAAERAWLEFGQRSGKRVLIFRLAGIYGPGRSAIDAVRTGSARRIIRPGQMFNRTHVEDVAGVVAAAFERPGQHQIYNVADDEPAPPQDVIAFAANLLNLPLPPAVAFEDAGLSPMGASFYAECKLVRNTRMKQDLGVQLAFPTYREGLTGIASLVSDR